MVLVDTTIWIAHFRKTNTDLVELLKTHQAVCHPFIVAEIASGTPPFRHHTLPGLKYLRQAEVATMTEVLEAIESRRLHGRGCGLVALSLLTSVLAKPEMKLWTLDKCLADLAEELGLNFHPR